jgi:hypothetical protein
MAKAELNLVETEPNLDEVNRLLRGEIVPPNTEIGCAFVTLQSENARLKASAKADAEKAALNEKIHKKNSDDWRRENLRLQEQLLASQERVYELQAKLLSLRQIVNGT